MTDINILSHEACEEDLQSEEFQTKTTGKCESRVKNHENEDVDFLPAERIPAYEDKEDFQSTTLPKIEEETLDKEPSPEPEQLLKSSEKGIVDHVVSILDKEPSLVNCKDSDGYTPLHRASYNGHVNVVRILLQRGADVDSKTEDGWQPLHCACRWGKCIALQPVKGLKGVPMGALTFQNQQNDGMGLVCLWLASPWFTCS